MGFMRLPPEISERRDEQPERPLRSPPDKIGTWSCLAQTYNGWLHLAEHKSGIDLFWRREPGTHLDRGWLMSSLCDLYRGLAAVCQGQDGVAYETYHPLPTDDPDEFYVCMLPPGIYVVTPGPGPEGQILWWYDPSWLDEVQERRDKYWPTLHTNPSPQLPPEVVAKLKPTIKPTIKRLRLKPKIPKASFRER